MRRGTETEMEEGRVSVMDNAVTANPSIKENDTAGFRPTWKPCLYPVCVDLKGSWGLHPWREWSANEISNIEQVRLTVFTETT